MRESERARARFFLASALARTQPLFARTDKLVFNDKSTTLVDGYKPLKKTAKEVRVWRVRTHGRQSDAQPLRSGFRTRPRTRVRAARAGERVPLVETGKRAPHFASSQHAPVLVLLVLVLAAVLDLVQDLLRDHREVLHGLSL